MPLVAGDRAFQQGIADWMLKEGFPELAHLGRYKPFAAMGLKTDDGKLYGGLILTNYTGFDAELTVYVSKMYLMRIQDLKRLFHWFFDDMGLVRMTARIAPDNERSINIAKKLGFQQEGIIRKGLDGKRDVILFGLLREDCKLLVTPKAADGRAADIEHDGNLS